MKLNGPIEKKKLTSNKTTLYFPPKSNKTTTTIKHSKMHISKRSIKCIQPKKKKKKRDQ